MDREFPNGGGPRIEHDHNADRILTQDVRVHGIGAVSSLLSVSRAAEGSGTAFCSSLGVIEVVMLIEERMDLCGIQFYREPVSSSRCQAGRAHEGRA